MEDKMDFETIFDEIAMLIISVSEDELTSSNITRDTNLIEDIGLDSIKIIKLIIDIEEKFSLFFDVEILAADNIFIFGNLVQYVYDLLNKN